MLSLGQLVTAIRELHIKVASAQLSIDRAEAYEEAAATAFKMLKIVEKELERMRD